MGRLCVLKQRILVVESDLAFRSLLTLVLSKAGYEITESDNGADAIKRANAIHPDLIILDLELPAMQGDEVLERLKVFPTTMLIPVIITTSLDKDDLSVQRARQAGAAKILYKPTRLAVFEQEVRRFLPRTN